jgi:hypothetical protein
MHGGAFTACILTSEQTAVPSSRRSSQSTFDRVVVDFQPAIIDVLK